MLPLVQSTFFFSGAHFMSMHSENEPANPVALVLDDDPICAQELARYLTRNFIPAVPATNIAAARDALDRHDGIKVLISDIRMPDMSGIEFAIDLANSHAAEQPLKVLFMTGQATVDLAVAALRIGASDFLTKPVRPRQVAERVTKLLAEPTPIRAVVPVATPEPEAPAATVATQAHWLLKERKGRMAREKIMGEGFKDEPGWNMIMELMHARLSGQKVPVSALCAASGVPQTTALRRLGELMGDGYIAKERDPNDARRLWVRPTERTVELVQKYMTHEATVRAAA
jgi:DNA-binding response OmpR family regulator